MNILLLFLMKKILKLHTGLFRMLIGSAAGTAIMIVVFLNTILSRWEEAVIYYILLLIIMIRIAFGKAGILVIIARMCCMYALTFFVGGMGNFICHQTQQRKRVNSYIRADLWKDSMGKEMYNSTSTMGIEEILILAGAILILLPIILKVSEYIKQEYLTKCRVLLCYEGKSITGMALIDTGNQLKDWLTNHPVTIVQGDFINIMLGENLKKKIKEYQMVEFGNGEVFLNTKETLKYIPYHSLGNENGMLVGIYLDEMTLFIKGKKKEIKHPLIGIYPGKLSENQEYQIILHREFIE